MPSANGGRRTAASTIDASGKLPDGAEFEGPAGLKKLLVDSYRDDFVATAAEKLLTYATGRGLEALRYAGRAGYHAEGRGDNYRLSALITAVVESTPFQMRRTPEP